MEIAVYENRQPAGLLRVSAQGLYTLFEARVEGRGKGLSRLWLADGRGRAAALGVLAPGGGERLLRRRMSRLVLVGLAERAWRALVLPAEEKPGLPAGDRRADLGPEPSEERVIRPAAAWLRLPDGSLRDPGRGLLALPWAGGELPEGVERVRLNGREYWVFHT